MTREIGSLPAIVVTRELRQWGIRQPVDDLRQQVKKSEQIGYWLRDEEEPGSKSVTLRLKGKEARGKALCFITPDKGEPVLNILDGRKIKGLGVGIRRIEAGDSYLELETGERIQRLNPFSFRKTIIVRNNGIITHHGEYL